MTQFIRHMLWCVWLILSVCGSARTQRRQQILFPDTNDSFDESLENAQFSQFAISVNSLQSIQDFINYFNIDVEPEEEKNILSLRSGGNSDKVITDLPSAVCKLEMTTVQLNLPEEKGMRYVPTCVRVERCGGCCNLEPHSCQPLETKTINVKLLQINNEIMMFKRGRRRVRKHAISKSTPVEVHTKCDCKCKIKKQDCNLNIHTYNKHQCSCVCEDKGAVRRCFNSDKHFWNNDHCDCPCRNVEPCSIGQTFDQTSCSCQ